MKVNNSFPITLVIISIPSLVIAVFTYVVVEYYIQFLDICSHYSQRSMILCSIDFFFPSWTVCRHIIRVTGYGTMPLLLLFRETGVVINSLAAALGLFQILDWMWSTHLYLVSPKLFFYWCIKCQPLVYPGTTMSTHWGRVTQICVFTLQLCKTDDANLRF